MTAKALPRLDEDDRILPILSHLSEGMLAGLQSDYGFTAPENTTEIRADMIDELSRKHFPLCMRNLHENLRKDKHLKHTARLQYGLFLKVGLLRESMELLLTHVRHYRDLDCRLRRRLYFGGSHIEAEKCATTSSKSRTSTISGTITDKKASVQTTHQ